MIELASPGTVRRDNLGTKEDYAAFGVREYVQFDPLDPDDLEAPLLVPPLQVWRLAGGTYASVAAGPGGGVPSGGMGRAGVGAGGWARAAARRRQRGAAAHRRREGSGGAGARRCGSECASARRRMLRRRKQHACARKLRPRERTPVPMRLRHR